MVFTSLPYLLTVVLLLVYMGLNHVCKDPQWVASSPIWGRVCKGDYEYNLAIAATLALIGCSLAKRVIRKMEKG
eukprot:NODE_11379_length_283_cov_5.394737.p2 GENE.NODE_11379_length_283_cov_5.394737~~NODE_11379_length_283_cov_5.394737.p2  ORF type:complete len:74 (-),score=10.11 NODE_11379_length_283_cov_5.394737:61-282(-)